MRRATELYDIKGDVMFIESTSALKQMNKERIRKESQKCESFTKSQIAKMTGLSVATCNTFLNEMFSTGEIFKVDQEELIMGRPADRFSYNKDYHHVMGLYVYSARGENTICYTVADALGNWLDREKKEVKIITYDEILGVVTSAVKQDPLIRSISVGIPGITRHGVVESCDIESLVGSDLEGGLTSETKIDVEVRNDMDFLTYGAYYTMYQGKDNLATVFFPEDSTGTFGCGFIINGRILRGHTRFSGELAYVLEAFGISREQQVMDGNDPEKLRNNMSKVIMTITAVIDPEEIILLSKSLSDENLNIILELCTDIIPKDHIPKIVVEHDYEGLYSSGLIRASIGRLQYPILNPM